MHKTYMNHQGNSDGVEHSGRWSGGAMVLSKLPVLGHPTIWIIVGQGPIALAVGAGGGGGVRTGGELFTHFYSPLSFLSSFSLSLSLSLWETARYRLKYCLKGLNPKQPTSRT